MSDTPTPDTLQGLLALMRQQADDVWHVSGHQDCARTLNDYAQRFEAVFAALAPSAPPASAPEGSEPTMEQIADLARSGYTGPVGRNGFMVRPTWTTTDASNLPASARTVTRYRIDLQTKCLISDDGNWVEDADDKQVVLYAEVAALLKVLAEAETNHRKLLDELGFEHEAFLKADKEIQRLNGILLKLHNPSMHEGSDGPEGCEICRSVR